jgi:hypothetical protein
VCVGPSDKFEKFAKPGVNLIDPGAPLLVRYDQRSIFEAYNSMIDEALELGVSGLVLLHDDVALRDLEFPSKVSALFTDPSVGIVGAIGASGVKSVDWWLYDTHGRVEETELVIDFGRGTFDVEVVDGVLIALSSGAMRQLRFDAERYTGFHGYDSDIGMQARSAGLRVIVTDFELFHDSYPHGKITDRAAWLRADRIWRRKWRGSLADRIVFMKAVWSSDFQGPFGKIVRLSGPLAPYGYRVLALAETVRRKVRRSLARTGLMWH